MKRALLVIFGTAAMILPGNVAVATPVGTSHCPAPESSFISWDTSTEPYRVDNLVDKNGNGVACAKAFPNGETFVLDGVTYTLYQFRDDIIR